MLRRIDGGATPGRSLPAAVMAPNPSIRSRVITKPWTVFDTRYFGTTAFPGDGGAFNFAQMQNPTQFFNVPQRQFSQQSGVFSTVADTGKMDSDFIADLIAVEVHAPSDMVASTINALQVATASAFAEMIIGHGILRFDFGSSPEYLTPVSHCPAGGGTYIPAKIRTQAAAANSESAVAMNGEPTATALRRLPEPMRFKKGDSFSCSLIVPTPTLTKIQALAPLVGNDLAFIRVSLIGIKGEDLMKAWMEDPGSLPVRQYSII